MNDIGHRRLLTREVRLWVLNDEGLYNSFKECTTLEQTEELGEELANFLPCSAFAQILINKALGLIDWEEIYEAVQDEDEV